MSNHPVSKLIGDFHVRHGGECYSDGARFLYADGSWRELNPLGAMAEPPKATTRDGEYQLAENKLAFARLKLKQAVQRFDDLNTRLAHTNPIDPASALVELERLQKTVNLQKTNVAKAERDLDNTAKGRQRKTSMESRDNQQQRFSDFQSKRRLIRI